MTDERPWQADAITIPPTITGRAGRAWLVDPAVASEREAAEIACWVIEASFAHPVWHSYALLCIHLRPIEGVPAPTMYLEDATHEIILFALNPDKPREPAVRGLKLPCLEPANFAAQLIEVSDDLARGRIESVVRLVCDGKLSPDTDYLRAWVKLFGDNMIKKEWR